MEDKLRIPYPIIVEGKYDRLRLMSLVEGRIYTTEGFGIFSKGEKLALFRALAKKTPIIVLTDSDGAGKLIRSHITSALPKERLLQLYIPSVIGKEKRKKEPSKEGTLGVEGMEQQLLYDLLAPFENEERFKASEQNPISKTDFYRDGLSGGSNSAALRDRLASKLELPSGMSANALLAAIKILISYEQYEQLIKELYEQGI